MQSLRIMPSQASQSSFRRTCFTLYLPNLPSLHHQQQRKAPTFVPSQPRKLLESQLVTLLDAASNLSHIKQVHAHLLRKGLDQCSYVITKLVRTLTKLEIPIYSYPRLVFEQVRYRNPFLWTAMIRGYAIQGLFSESVRLYNCMRREGIGPVSFTFSALFKACGSVLDMGLGTQVHAQSIFVGGFASDLHVGNAMIDMYVKCGLLDYGRKVFDEMVVRDVISWTALIVAYAKIGNMELAGKLFDGLPVKDMVAWTAMVTGYAQNARPREAVEFFIRMQDAGVETDYVTLVGVISACAQLGASEHANWIRDIACKSRFKPTDNVVVESALIDMFSKCGNVEDAHNVFVGMMERNVFSYSSMILGYAMHGRAHEAIELFHVMLKTEIKPNHVTFIGVLMACTHANLVDQGWQIFIMMEKFYGVAPTVEHYACVTDLLGRGGRLEEALWLVQTMPMEPNGAVWGALLGASNIHRNPDIAEIAASHLFKLEPDCIGNYILLSKIYASAGRWDDVSRVRKLMREKGLKKSPGCSWVEGKKGVIHEFFAGSMTHSNASEIKQKLEDLMDKLETDGYKPHLSSVPYDVSDEEKRRLLMDHSEKLALAYGLLNSDSGGTVKIMKNIRICEDCHAVMCGASKITRRKIIVRDNVRFHHFHNGECSCCNFW